MLCMYMEGAVTKLDILGGGNRVVKEFILHGNSIKFVSKYL